MSNSYAVFVKGLPSRQELQNYLDEAKIPIKLLKSLEVAEYSGFVPMMIGSYKAGVEVYIDDFDPNHIPEANDLIGDRKKVISLCWGSNNTGACCALGIAAALVKCADGMAFFGCFETFEQLKTQFNEALPLARAEARNTPHRVLLRTVAQRLPNFANRGNIFYHLPLGETARGMFIVPAQTYFEVTFLLKPLYVAADYFGYCWIPKKANIPGGGFEISTTSVPPTRWRYDNPNTVDDIVDIANNYLEPYFKSIECPQALADAMYEQYQNGPVHDLEATGMACAAAGKYDKALEMFDKVKVGSNPNQQYDFLLELGKRCDTIAALIRQERYDEIHLQLGKWKDYTIRKNKLGGLAKATR